MSGNLAVDRRVVARTLLSAASRFVLTLRSSHYNAHRQDESRRATPDQEVLGGYCP